MKRKLIHAFTGAAADAVAYDRIAAGRHLRDGMLDGVDLTDAEIVFTKGLRRLYVPLNEIVWAFRRVEESHVTLGCCGGVLQQFLVVLHRQDGQEASVLFEREENALTTLAHIEAHTSAAIGYTQQNRQRFAGT